MTYSSFTSKKFSSSLLIFLEQMTVIQLVKKFLAMKAKIYHHVQKAHHWWTIP
jgi:hypothetical protein